MKFRTFLSLTLALGLSILTTDRAFAGDLSASPYRVLPTVPVVGAELGTSVAVGDLNGDGFVDVAVGAPHYPNSGRVFVFLNSAAGLASTTSANWIAIGNDPDSLFGAAIAVADLDEDGYGDLIVGAPSYHSAGTSVGAVFVYRGGAVGLASPSPAWTSVGSQPGGEFGAAVATGDLDGDSDADSHLDVVVGAPGSGNGAVHAYGTSGSGLAVVPSTVLGDQLGGRFGHAIAVRDLDLDGHGKADVIIGAPNDQAENGRVFICPGSVTGIGPATWNVDGTDPLSRFGTAVTAGDVTGDGRPDVIVGAPIGSPIAGKVRVYAGNAVGLPATSSSWTATGEESDSRFGIAVASGDLNGDGRPDLVVGAPLNGVLLGSVTGRIYVYLGTPSGLAMTAAPTRDGALANESFGRALAIAPINADGFADLVVGAPGSDHAYVYTGSCSTITIYPDVDDDSYGDGASAPTEVCVGSPTTGYALNNDDCQDTDPAIHPGAFEVPGDGIDQSCDGRELCFTDLDGDHYGRPPLVVSSLGDLACAGTFVAPYNADCDDNHVDIHPNAVEVAGNNIDENCDGQDAAAAPPQTVIETGPPLKSNNAVATFTFSSDTGVTFECALDGPPFGPCTAVGSHTTGALAEGLHTFEVRAVDQYAVVDPTPAPYSWIVDLTPPQTTLLRQGDTPSGPIVSFILTANEIATFECDLDDTGFVPCDFDFTTPTLAAGEHKLVVRAIDEAGNVDPTPASEIWLVDGDDDGDGYTFDDCDDGDAAIHPNATEICSDVVDNDCDGQADCPDPDCAGDATCASPCSGGPFSCKNPGVTKLDLRNVTPDDGDKLAFRWTLGDETSALELGDPTVDTQYAVCVWDHVAGTPVLVMEMVAPPAGNCLGRPCWRAAGDGFRYWDPGHLPSGVDKLNVQAGPFGKSSIKVTGRGGKLPDPPMPFQQDSHIIVQVVNSLGTCWGADYVSPAQSNTDTRLEAKEKP